MTVFQDLRKIIKDLSTEIETQKPIKIGKEANFSSLLDWFDRNKTKSPSLDTFSQKIKSGRVPYDHFEKHMMPKAPNIYPSKRQSGFSSILNTFSSVYSKIEDEIEKKQINQIRFRIHKLMVSLVDFLQNTSSISFLIDSYSDYDIERIVRFKYEWRSLIGDEESSLRDQLIEMRTKLAVLVSEYRSVQNKMENTKDSEKIDADISAINVIKTEVDRILLSASSETEIVVEDISSLINYHEIDSVQRGRLDNVEAIIKNPLFKHVKSDYVRAQVSSINVAASSVNGGTQDQRVAHDEVTQSFTPEASMTPSSLDQGDAIQADTSTSGPEYTDAVGPLTKDDMKVFLSWLGKRESSNDYTRTNQYNYIGRWQHGSPSLQDLGYVKSGVSNKGMKRKSSWTGKNGITSQQAFLGNSSEQDKAIIVWMKMLYRRILNVRAITTESSKADVAGYLAVAHLLGAGGARDLKNGRIGSDANGTTARDYYNGGSSSVGGSVDVANAEHAAANRQDAMYNSLPSGSPIIVPSTSGASVYPYNKTRTFEAGHIEEFDSTPGSERVSVRHASGTGYDLLPDGNRVETINRDNYKVTLGNDYMIVNGFVNIYVEGDAGITAQNINLKSMNDTNMMVGGDFNLNVGGNTNMVMNGKKQEIVQGDSAETVGGFKTTGILGDHQIEAESITLNAKTGNLNMMSNANASLISHEKMAIISADTTKIVSEGEIDITTSDKLTTTSAADTTIYSEAEVVTHGDGGNLVSSFAQTSIAGAGVIKLSHPVEKSLYSDTAGQAPLGAPIPVIPSAAANDNGGSGTHSSNSDKSDPDSVEKTIEEFKPSDFDESQANQHGPISSYQPSKNQPIDT